MTSPDNPPLQNLRFYVTAPYSCGYLEGRLAQSLIAAPHQLIDAHAYNTLIQIGFRRSGKFVYRPHCENCKACVPVRLPVKKPKPDRSQRRALTRHRSLEASILPLQFSREHLALYNAYQIARHDGDKDAGERELAEQYSNFLVQSNVDSMLVEFRLDDVLKMVSVVDIVSDGVSAVYTFYETGDAAASYGTYNILWLTDWCRSLNLPYLYLGYWIKDSPKMAYKRNFLPQEILVDGEWKTVPDLSIR